MGVDIIAKKKNDEAENVEGTAQPKPAARAKASAQPAPASRAKETPQPQEAGGEDAAPAQRPVEASAADGQEGAAAAAPVGSSEPSPAASEGEGGFSLKYDVTSQERYVDSTSQKTEFDKVLDELGRISKDVLAWDLERFTKRHQGDGDEADALAKKFDAFLGSFITNAALELYDRGYPDAAFKRLEQARNVLEAKRKLEVEVESIKAKNEEDAMDLSDLGLF